MGTPLKISYATTGAVVPIGTGVNDLKHKRKYTMQKWLCE